MWNTKSVDFVQLSFSFSHMYMSFVDTRDRSPRHQV